MERINEHIKKAQNELLQRRSYEKSCDYVRPDTKKIKYARFVAKIEFNPSEKYPKGGYKIEESLEHLRKSQLNLIDEWIGWKTLLAFILKLKKQDRLKEARIYMSLDPLPILEHRNHKELITIINPYRKIVNNSLTFETKEQNIIVNLDKFVRQWLK